MLRHRRRAHMALAMLSLVLLTLLCVVPSSASRDTCEVGDEGCSAIVGPASTSPSPSHRAIVTAAVDASPTADTASVDPPSKIKGLDDLGDMIWSAMRKYIKDTSSFFYILAGAPPSFVDLYATPNYPRAAADEVPGVPAGVLASIILFAITFLLGIVLCVVGSVMSRHRGRRRKSSGGDDDANRSKKGPKFVGGLMLICAAALCAISIIMVWTGSRQASSGYASMADEVLVPLALELQEPEPFKGALEDFTKHIMVAGQTLDEDINGLIVDTPATLALTMAGEIYDAVVDPVNEALAELTALRKMTEGISGLEGVADALNVENYLPGDLLVYPGEPGEPEETEEEGVGNGEETVEEEVEESHNGEDGEEEGVVEEGVQEEVQEEVEESVEVEEAETATTRVNAWVLDSTMRLKRLADGGSSEENGAPRLSEAKLRTWTSDLIASVGADAQLDLRLSELLPFQSLDEVTELIRNLADTKVGDLLGMGSDGGDGEGMTVADLVMAFVDEETYKLMLIDMMGLSESMAGIMTGMVTKAGWLPALIWTAVVLIIAIPVIFTILCCGKKTSTATRVGSCIAGPLVAIWSLLVAVVSVGFMIIGLIYLAGIYNDDDGNLYAMGGTLRSELNLEHMSMSGFGESLVLNLLPDDLMSGLLDSETQDLVDAMGVNWNIVLEDFIHALAQGMPQVLLNDKSEDQGSVFDVTGAGAIFRLAVMSVNSEALLNYVAEKSGAASGEGWVDYAASLLDLTELIPKDTSGGGGSGGGSGGQMLIPPSILQDVDSTQNQLMSQATDQVLCPVYNTISHPEVQAVCNYVGVGDPDYMSLVDYLDGYFTNLMSFNPTQYQQEKGFHDVVKQMNVIHALVAQIHLGVTKINSLLMNVFLTLSDANDEIVKPVLETAPEMVELKLKKTFEDLLNEVGKAQLMQSNWMMETSESMRKGITVGLPHGPIGFAWAALALCCGAFVALLGSVCVVAGIPKK